MSPIQEDTSNSDINNNTVSIAATFDIINNDNNDNNNGRQTLDEHNGMTQCHLLA